MLSDAQALRDLSLEKFNEFPLDTVFGMATPAYAKAITSPSLKYKIFKVNGDEVLVLFKQVNMFKVHYKRLLGTPISKTRNRRIELALFKKLMQLEDVTEVQLLEQNAKDFGIPFSSATLNGAEFTVNPKEVIKTMNGKYRQRYFINKYKDDIEFRDVKESDFINIINLLNDWIKHKDSEEGVHSKPIYKNIIKDPYKYLMGDYVTKVIYYKGDLFAFSVYSVTSDKVFQITNIVSTFNDYFPHNLIKGGNRIVYYYAIQEFQDKNAISYMGSIDLKSNVFKNKELVYKTYDNVHRVQFKK